MISHETFRTVEGVFTIEEDAPLKVRGRKEPLATYQVKSAKPRAFRVVARGVQGVETDMIGHEAELKRLQNAFDDAVEEEETQVITIISEAGLGKSRLLYEFGRWADLHPTTYWIFRGRATSAMTHRPYALIRDIISYRFEILDSDAPEVVQQKLEAGVVYVIGKEDTEIAHMIGHLVGFDLSDSLHIKGLLDDAPQLTARARQLFKRLIAQAIEQSPVVVELEDIPLCG